MFEETTQSCSQARFNACQRQCRIARFMAGEDILVGGCFCDKPNECMASLHNSEGLPLGQDEYFADVKWFWQQLCTE